MFANTILIIYLPRKYSKLSKFRCQSVKILCPQIGFFGNPRKYHVCENFLSYIIHFPPPPSSGPPPAGPPPSYESTQGSSYASAPPPSGPYASASAPPPDCSGNAGNTGNGGNGGFWSGAATGGVLGYLFGNSGNRRHQNRGWGNNGGWGGWGNNGGWGGWGNQNRGWGGWGNSWGSNQQQHHHHHHTNDNNHTNFFSSSSSSRRSTSPTSSGTRTASGFGGTSRR